MSFAANSHIRILEPQDAHATLGIEDLCAIHVPNGGDPQSRYFHPPRVRLYTLRRGRRLIGRMDDGRQVVLEHGVTLRLDAELGQHFREQVDYGIRTRVFCVLDGHQAGTCWEELLVYPLAGVPGAYVDPLQQLAVS